MSTPGNHTVTATEAITAANTGIGGVNSYSLTIPDHRPVKFLRARLSKFRKLAMTTPIDRPNLDNIVLLAGEPERPKWMTGKNRAK